jgi:hypothetical protein
MSKILFNKRISTLSVEKKDGSIEMKKGWSARRAFNKLRKTKVILVKL